MKIRERFISFLMAFILLFSFGQAIRVEAATIDSSVTSEGTVTDTKTLVPNPGIPENKPNSLNVTGQYDSKSLNGPGHNDINITSNIGWKKINGTWYYLKSDNTKASGWINPDGTWYYLYSEGTMAVGWLNSSGTWYYLDSNGSMAKGWRQLNNIWYFFNDSGAMITGLNTIDNKNYMFYSSGPMVQGWLQISNNWYYFNKSGSMASGWIYDSSAWYYLYDTGAMAKGWIKLNEAWYYLKGNGAMATGFVNSGSDYYYLDPSSGSLRTNTAIDGYIIGADGKRTGTGTIYKGIDISHYNGDINFAKVKASGIQLVYMKATEGTTYVDSYLETYYSGAKKAGLKTGFYHFLVGTSSPETQAQNFYNNIKNKQSDLKPVLDVETNDFDVMGYAIRFANEFKRLSNMEVCIYTYSAFISNLDNRLSKYTLWEANYHTSFDNLPPNNIWTSRAGFQYTDKGYVDGINGDVDLDQFTVDIFRQAI